MIYVHNQGITGINIHSKIIDSVYHGNRLVWLRNSTADSFTIVGDSSIFAGHAYTFRAKYAGSDDILYEWSFSGVTPETIVYNHNHRKVTIITSYEDYDKTMTITCVMTRIDGTQLTSTNSVYVNESKAIEIVNIEDIIFENDDSSLYGNFIIIPPTHTDEYSVSDVSIGLNDYTDLESYDKFGITAYQKQINTTDIIMSARSSATITDEFGNVFDASGNVYSINPLQYFSIEGQIDRTPLMKNRIDIGFRCSSYNGYKRVKGVGICTSYTSDGDPTYVKEDLKVYKNITTHPSYGLNGIVEKGTTTPYAASQLEELGRISTIDYNTVYYASFTDNMPPFAVKTGDVYVYIMVKFIYGNDLLTLCKPVTVPQAYADIEGKYARYVFVIYIVDNETLDVRFDISKSKIEQI